MRKVLFVMIAVVALSHAGQRKVVTKIVKADTVVTIKMDTIKTVTYDTLLVRQLVQDSSWVVKADTVKAAEVKKEDTEKAPEVKKEDTVKAKPAKSPDTKKAKK